MALVTHRHRHLADIEVFVTFKKKRQDLEEKRANISHDIYKQSDHRHIEIEILFFFLL